jgi:DNA-binding response OmpR family regulator
VESGLAALEPAATSDVVLLDNQLPDTTGIDLLPRLLAQPNPPSVIMVTGEGSEELAANAMRLGAEDYLVKGPMLFESLPGLVERARRNRLLRSTRAEVERDLVRAERLAAIGEMTVTLHHNINNPLMSASADLEMLLAAPDMPLPQRQQTLRDIQTALHRIRDLVRQIADLRDVRTKPYLPGIRMVDLEGAGPAAQAPHLGTALVQVGEEDLARVVVLLLRHAGFAVERCGTVGELRTSAGGLGVSLVLVLGGTDAAGAHPLGGFDPPPNRAYRVVALVAGDGAAARAAGADRVVELPFDPGSFTADMVALLANER